MSPSLSSSNLKEDSDQMTIACLTECLLTHMMATLDGNYHANGICGTNKACDDLVHLWCHRMDPMERIRLCSGIRFLDCRCVDIAPSGLDVFQWVYVGPNLVKESQIDCDWWYNFNSRFPVSNLCQPSFDEEAFWWKLVETKIQKIN